MPEDLSFVYPWRLWLLVAVLALAVAMIVAGARRRKAGSAYADAALLGTVAPQRPGWRGVPGKVLVVLALGAMTLAWAEPEALAENAREKSVVMVALDVSGSMLVEDIPPNRFEVARDAIASFVGDLPEEVDVGLVTFAGTAQIVVPPSADHSKVLNALPGLDNGDGTAQGDAILACLSAIKSALPRVEPGQTPAARIVLLSDGTSPDGTPVPVAVSKAIELGVPISTIALGGGADGRGVAFDGEVLRSTAEATGGIAYQATDIDSLAGVYDDIGSQVERDTRREPLSAAGIGIALALLLAGLVSTVLLTGRAP